MSREKDLSFVALSEELEARPAEPASPAPVQSEPAARGSALHRSLGNAALAAAASGGPPTNNGDPFPVHTRVGNAAAAHTLILRKAESEGAGSVNAPGLPAPAAQPGQGPAAQTSVPTQALIVEDTTETIGPAQMKKSQFLADLRAAVCNATAQGLAGTPWSEVGCPYIQHWFGYYSRQSSEHIERAIRKYAPETATVTTANALIPPVAARVRRAVTTWATTGEVTGVPEGMPLSLPEAPGLGAVGAIAGIAGASGLVAAAGSALSSVGNLLFKERDGGANELADPGAIQTQLGAGQSLDGGVRSRMEAAYGESFTGVQVHTDTNAAGLSENLNARAFTVGGHIAFGTGEYKPGTPIGDALIAHELAHVMQQRNAGGAVTTQSSGGGAYSALEEDADEAAVGAVVSTWSGARTKIAKNAMPSLKSGLRLQRCGDKKPSPPPPPALPTFEIYQERFNTLWNTAPFNAMPAADAGFDPALDSRGPRTRKARRIFDKILADDPAMLTHYKANTGGMRDRIDVYIGPEGLNLINSPRLTALQAAFLAHPKPVLPAGYPALRTSVQTAAAALDPADRLAVERSNEWQRLINEYVTDGTKRTEIREIISPQTPNAPVAPVQPGPAQPVGPRGTPAQRTTFLATWTPKITFNDATRQVALTNASIVHYLSGAQNFEVGATLPAGQTNPGLVLSIRGQILRGAVVISAAQEAPFPPDANSSSQFPMPIIAPAVVPPLGDALTIRLEVLEPSGAVLSTKNVAVKVLPEITYTQAAAEAEATADDTFFHNATAQGLIGKMTNRGGLEANVAEALNAGRLVLRPLTVRHDSTAFVAAQNGGVPDPTKVAYFVGPTYANSIVLPPNAGGTTLTVPPGIVVNRTTNVKTKAKRTDAEVTLFFVHEAVHAMDIEPTEIGSIQNYRTEFRAYWMDGRFGPPNAGGPDTIYDPNMPPPGPKSPRARQIFNFLVNGSTYPQLSRAYDSDAAFRQMVDNYHIPDGINLMVSTRLDSLRNLIETWGGAGFPAFRTSVRAFVGVGPPPAGGVLLPNERSDVQRNRSWRLLVERKVTVPAEQTQIMADLGIP